MDSPPAGGWCPSPLSPTWSRTRVQSRSELLAAAVAAGADMLISDAAADALDAGWAPLAVLTHVKVTGIAAFPGGAAAISQAVSHRTRDHRDEGDACSRSVSHEASSRCAAQVLSVRIEPALPRRYGSPCTRRSGQRGPSLAASRCGSCTPSPRDGGSASSASKRASCGWLAYAPGRVGLARHAA